MDLGDVAERLAEEASDESGLNDRPHADPLVLAVSYLDLRLIPRAMRGARLVDNCILYSLDADEQHAAYVVSHEVGHFLARDAGLRLSRADEEIVASRIGCALLLPRRAFLRDVRDGVRVVADLAALWPLATTRIVRRRLVELDALVLA